MTPFDPSTVRPELIEGTNDSGLRVTGHGEPVEPCDWYSLGNDSNAQLFMTLCIIMLGMFVAGYGVVV